MTDKSVVAIDWSQPIEAVHTDGRVVAVYLQPSREQPDCDGDYSTEPMMSDGSNVWFSTGENWSGSPWHIRNVASNPLNLETSDLDPITPEEDAVATAIIAAVGWTRQSHDTVVRAIRYGLVKAGAVIVPVECTDEIAEAIATTASCCGGIAETVWTKAVAAALSIQSGGEGGEA